MRKWTRRVLGILRLLIELVLNAGNVKIHGYKYFVGRGARFNTEKGGSIDLGKKTWVSENTYFSANEGSISLGYNNFFNSNITMIAKRGITIGDNNLFGPNVVIVDHNHNYADPSQLICKQGYTAEQIVLGSDIWVGANTTICAGVQICDRVVIGANSVVTKSIAESGIYAGSPAKKIRNI